MKRVLVLLIVSITLLILAPMLIRPVEVLEQIRTSNGEIIRRPDGRPQFRRDRLGEFRVNWDAYLCFASGGVAFVWALFCGGKLLYGRRKHTNEIAQPSPQSPPPSPPSPTIEPLEQRRFL